MQLTLSHISKSYGDQPVLDQVSLLIADGRRIGLVGANGVGKSTLLKIIAGEIEPDSGKLILPADIQIGYLPQSEVEADDSATINDLIDQAVAALRQLEARMRALERAMASGRDELDAIMAEYGDIAEQFERRGGYEMDYRIEVVLGGLHLDHIARSRRVTTLSGGEKARLGLALLLLKAPDVLLLDEPTNHLDLSSLGWLEDYLTRYRGAVLMVSHDREFLNRTVNLIVEIDEHSHQAKSYSGDYDAYLAAKAQERERWLIDFERQQDEIKALRHEIKVTARNVNHKRPARDNDKFWIGFKDGRTNVAIARRVASAEERLARIEADPIPRPPDPLRFEPEFDPQALKGRMPLIASGLIKAFGERRVLDEVSFTLGARSRIVLVGPNGAGKTTLLRLLAGVDVPDQGEIILNPQVRIGYLDQEQETLDPTETVLQAYQNGQHGEERPVTEQQIISVLLGSGFFRYDELGRRVGQLSSGMKRKLQIARLIADRANVLLLDEPTNYVSFDVLEALEGALRDFPGPIIAVSHDRRFLNHFGGEVWDLRDGRLVQYQNADEYLAAASV